MTSHPVPSVKPTTIAATASFTTSGPWNATANIKEPGMSRHIRSGKRLVLGRSRKPIPSRGKRPEIGERKAYRKRIQLSNNNALPVEGLAELNRANIADPNSIGTVVGLPDDLVDRLRAVEAFKPTQKWGLFRSPHMLVRAETVELTRRINHAAAHQETARLVITGERGSGKSILGLQAIANAFLNDWIVINLPEGENRDEGAKPQCLSFFFFLCCY